MVQIKEDILYTIYETIKLWWYDERNVTVKVGGSEFQIYAEPSISPNDRHIIMQGQHEPMITQAVCSSLNSGDTFIDAGANIGYYSLLASDIVGKKGFVHAFEPGVKAREKLRRNCELNAAENIEIHKQGLGEKEDERDLHVSDNFTMHSLANTSEKTTSVEIISLDTIGIKDVDLIKLDIEGYEFEALKGMTQTIEESNPIIILEFTPRFYQSLTEDLSGYTESFLAFLHERKYQVWNMSTDTKIKKAEQLLNGEESSQYHLYCKK